VEPSSDISLLLGNGILLCYEPNEFDFNLTLQDLDAQIKILLQTEYSEYRTKYAEDLLNLIRIEVSVKILSHYINIFKKRQDNSFREISNLQSYVQKYKNIFTLNYDPTTYRSIFSSTGEKNSLCDGFYPPKFISAQKVEVRIKGGGENGKGIYFLHGAFHIIYRFDPDKDRDKIHAYGKIKATENSRMIDNIKKKHDEITKILREDLRNHKARPTTCYEDILCVIGSKPIYKKAWIQNDEYLNFCYDTLSEQKKILTLGCSFKNDDHVLEKILPKDDSECLMIGVFNDQDRINVCETYKRLQNSSSFDTSKVDIDKVFFICTKNLGSVIWPQQT
jgi:hypothetical protein